MHGLDLMLRGPIVRTFLRYSIPWTLAMLTMSSAGVVDGLFVGRYTGALPLAAVNLVLPLYSLFFGMSLMFAAGGSVRAGKYLGEGRTDAACAIFTKTMIGLGAAGLTAAAAALIYSHELVLFLGAEGDLVEPAETYLRGLMVFGPIIPAGVALSYFVRVDGKPSLASGGLMLSSGVNIVLDALFIAGLGMGVGGAACATGIAYIFSTGVLLRHFFSPSAKLRFTRALGTWREVAQACWNGSSELINEASIGIVMMLINWILIERIGPYGVAAFTIINYAAWFGSSTCYAVGDSLTPLVSANFGARNFERVRRFFGLALGIVFGIGLLLYALFALYPQVLIEIFLPGDAQVAEVTLEFVDWFKLAFLFSGPNMALASFFTAMHLAGASAAVAILRGLIFPVLFLMVLPVLFGNAGVYAAIPCAELCTLVIGAGIFALTRRAFWGPETARRAEKAGGDAPRGNGR